METSHYNLTTFQDLRQKDKKEIINALFNFMEKELNEHKKIICIGNHPNNAINDKPIIINSPDELNKFKEDILQFKI